MTLCESTLHTLPKKVAELRHVLPISLEGRILRVADSGKKPEPARPTVALMRTHGGLEGEERIGGSMGDHDGKVAELIEVSKGIFGAKGVTHLAQPGER